MVASLSSSSSEDVTLLCSSLVSGSDSIPLVATSSSSSVTSLCTQIMFCHIWLLHYLSRHLKMSHYCFPNWFQALIQFRETQHHRRPSINSQHPRPRDRQRFLQFHCLGAWNQLYENNVSL